MHATGLDNNPSILCTIPWALIIQLAKVIPNCRQSLTQSYYAHHEEGITGHGEVHYIVAIVHLCHVVYDKHWPRELIIRGSTPCHGCG